MSATFEIKQRDDHYTFELIDKNNGDTLLIGGEYDQPGEVEKAIKDVKVGSLMGQQITAGKVKTGETFFVIKNSTGDIIAKSVLFNNQMVFDSTLHKVKDNACVATIEHA